MKCFIIKAKKFTGYFLALFCLNLMQHMVLLITVPLDIRIFIVKNLLVFLLFFHPFLFSLLGFTFSAGNKKAFS